MTQLQKARRQETTPEIAILREGFETGEPMLRVGKAIEGDQAAHIGGVFIDLQPFERTVGRPPKALDPMRRKITITLLEPNIDRFRRQRHPALILPSDLSGTVMESL